MQIKSLFGLSLLLFLLVDGYKISKCVCDRFSLNLSSASESISSTVIRNDHH